jgi:hypothetical protein
MKPTAKQSRSKNKNKRSSSWKRHTRLLNKSGRKTKPFTNKNKNSWNFNLKKKELRMKNKGTLMTR